jgi:hypothetical protein
MLGVGGVLVTMQARRAAEAMERARMMEMMAREEAERARVEAEAAAKLKAEKGIHEERTKDGQK